MTDAKPICTPMSTTCSLDTNDDTPSYDSSSFHSLIGSLHYLSLTWSDVAFVVNKLSQYMQAPSSIHMQALERILRYLKHTIFHDLYLVATKNLDLTAFCDADWGGDNFDRKSTSAYIVYLGPNAISWSCKKKSTVARSSTEVEYHTIETTMSKLLWIQQLLMELGIQIPKRPNIFSDNISATYLCENSVFHSQMKHLSIDYHFGRDIIAKCELTVSHVPSSHQLATKPLSRSQHDFLVSKIGVVDHSSILWGHIGTSTCAGNAAPWFSPSALHSSTGYLFKILHN